MAKNLHEWMNEQKYLKIVIGLYLIYSCHSELYKNIKLHTYEQKQQRKLNCEHFISDNNNHNLPLLTDICKTNFK